MVEYVNDWVVCGDVVGKGLWLVSNSPIVLVWSVSSIWLVEVNNVLSISETGVDVPE